MAFQTNVFRDGAWVTETVNLEAVLKASTASSSKETAHHRPMRPPQSGILTRTVVESQLVNWILPVRLRSSQLNDVAFVGDHFVQIKSLGSDGQFHDVLRKRDFGSRIRSVKVAGTLPDDLPRHLSEENGTYEVKSEEHEMFEPDTHAPSRETFPPQLLVLVLECGDTVFLFVRQRPDGSHEFVSTSFKGPGGHFEYAGFHLAVDPSSRYLVLARAHELFLVYELEAMATMSSQYKRQGAFRPVRSCRPRSVQGVIHKVEFLYPRPEDPQHVILLLVVANRGKSRIVTYDWQLGDDLARVLSEEKTGIRMPVDHQLPLFIIPLTVQSAFISISSSQIGVCTGALYGSPVFENFPLAARAATENHYGLQEPLWTAWSRPLRLSSYSNIRDSIYLAREDGVVIYLEADADSTLTGSTFMDKFDCNISTAFAAMVEKWSDVLILGGDSSPGGIWKFPARQVHEQIGILPNWSPTVDFITTDEFATWNQEIGSRGQKMVPWQERQPRTPDRIFATSGRGKKGSITEYRHGYQATIGLDLDYPVAARQAWLFRVDPLDTSLGYFILLSLPDRSAILHLSEDLSQASEPDPDGVPYDLTSRTIMAEQVSDEMVVQVTEGGIRLIGPGGSNRSVSHEELLQDADICISNAAILADHGLLALSTYDRAGLSEFKVHIVKIDGFGVARHLSFRIEGEITCLALYNFGEQKGLLAGVWSNGRPYLHESELQASVDSVELSRQSIAPILDEFADAGEGSPATTLAISSIATLADRNHRRNTVLVGLRNGDAYTLFRPAGKFVRERFGTLPVAMHSAGDHILVCCSPSLVLLSSLGTQQSRVTKHHVWPVDASSHAAVGPISAATLVQTSLSGNGARSVVLLSGTRILVAELQQEPGPVQRQIPVHGTPKRLIYSSSLECLVVALNKGDCPTLTFLDPDTGADIGQPTDREGKPTEFIGGLGKAGDKIYGLTEWEYRRERKTWRFILVSTDLGRLIVVSAEKETTGADQNDRKIRYWTRFQKKGYNRPIYSVLGHNDTVIYCCGDTIHVEVLDGDDKRLKPVSTFSLGTPARSLGIVNGKIVAVTVKDSIEIIHMETGDRKALLHADPRTRHAMHTMEVGGPGLDPLSSIFLLGDLDCGVVGLWTPWTAPGKNLVPVFEAELPTSILRFRRGRTRPLWEQEHHGERYGRIPSSADDAEILGLSVDGTLYSFTLLGPQIWRVLRFIQSLALASPEMYPYTYAPVETLEAELEPPVGHGLEMQIDGDMLQRCADKRWLEQLVSSQPLRGRFAELLDELEEGKHTAGFGSGEASHAKYFELAYDILEYYLVAVI